MGQVAQQIAFADRILLNKIDLVDAQHLAQVERRIRFSSPNYELLTTTLVLLTTDAQHLAQVERRIRFSSPEFCFPLRILYSLENTESLEIR
jgi:G3E family GTPase